MIHKYIIAFLQLANEETKKGISQQESNGKKHLQKMARVPEKNGSKNSFSIIPAFRRYMTLPNYNIIGSYIYI